MDLDEFLKRHVDGYLLSDLRSLQGFRLPMEAEHGWLGYPLAMTSLAGIELLGTLGAEDDHVSFGKGQDYFCWFWRTWLYPDSSTEQVARLVYKLLRDGVAHAFVAKPSVVVTRLQGPYHLKRTEQPNTLLIDADTLARDFESAYERYRTTLQKYPEFRRRVEARLQEFANIATKQSAGHAEALHTLPSVETRSSWQLSGRAVSSPTIQASLVLSTKSIRT